MKLDSPDHPSASEQAKRRAEAFIEAQEKARTLWRAVRDDSVGIEDFRAMVEDTKEQMLLLKRLRLEKVQSRVPTDTNAHSDGHLDRSASASLSAPA